MGEVNVQGQQHHTEFRDSVEPIEFLSMLHLNNPAASPCCHNHAPCNSTKRRSPETANAAATGERSAKKLFYDQEDLTLHGFSAVPLPVCLGSLAGKFAATGDCGGEQPGRPLQRTVSEPCKSHVGEFPECVAGGGSNQVTAQPQGRGQGLPPLPPMPPTGLRRTMSSPMKAFSPDSSVRLKRIKDRLKEMKQWFDVTMKDAEEDENEEEKEIEKEEEKEPPQQKDQVLNECSVVAEDDKVPSQDELEGEAEAEEAISVELADKCLNLTFWCPCGKGYEVLLSANKCYYKLV